MWWTMRQMLFQMLFPSFSWKIIYTIIPGSMGFSVIQQQGGTTGKKVCNLYLLFLQKEEKKYLSFKVLGTRRRQIFSLFVIIFLNVKSSLFFLFYKYPLQLPLTIGDHHVSSGYCVFDVSSKMDQLVDRLHKSRANIIDFPLNFVA